MTWFHHWILNDFYKPVWPNLAASAVTGVAVVKRFKVHLKNHRKWQARHFQVIHARMMNTSQPVTSTVVTSTSHPPTSEDVNGR